MGKGNEFMENKEKSLQETLFWAGFIVLTVLVWCPLGYGRYGEVGRMFGMPVWAVAALVFGVLLFVLEWVYLFMTGLALDDARLSSIMHQLSLLDSESTPRTKEVR